MTRDPGSGPSSRGARVAEALRCVAPLALLALFLQKPFHIDDVLFLNMGDMLPWLPWTDARGSLAFMGAIYQDLSPFESTHPVLIPYLLKAIGLAAGDGDPVFWVYHLVFLVFPFAIIWFARDVSRTLSLESSWIWLLALSPALFVNAGNLMTDIAMLAFWMGAVAGAARWAENGRRRDAVLTAVWIAAALLTSFQSAALFPLLAVFWLARGRLKGPAWFALAAPALLFALYLLGVYAVSGYFPFLASGIDLNIGSEVSSGLSAEGLMHKSVSVAVNLGFALLFATPLLALGRAPGRLALELAAAAVLSTALFWLAGRFDQFPGYAAWQMGVLRALALFGAWWVVRVVVDTAQCLMDGGERRGTAYTLLWFLWFGGVLFYNAVLMPYGIVRYLLPALPPALLLVSMRLPQRPRPALLIPCVTLSAALALLMARVDYRQARADLIVFQEVSKSIGPDDRLWFSDDGGLHRYLRALDAAYLPMLQTDAPVGDWVLVTRGLIHPELMADLALEREIAVPTFAGLTLFDTEANAGFYRSRDGFLPMAPDATARRAWLYRVDFFQANRDRAEILSVSHPHYHAQRTFDLGELGKKGVMFLHPEAKVAYPIDTGEATTLRGSVIGSPDDWSRDGDGVACTIGALTPDGEVSLWSAYLDGKNRSEDRVPREFTVRIPAEATHVWFSAEPGPNNDSRYDGVGWFNLRFSK